VSFDTSATTWITATTTAPTYGTIVRNEGLYSKNGAMTYYTWQFEQSSAGTAGSGDYLIKLPFKMDLTKYGLAQNFTDTSRLLKCGVEGNMFAEFSGPDYFQLGNFYIYDESTLYAVGRNVGTYNYYSSGFGQFSLTTIKLSLYLNVFTLGQTQQSQVISQYDGRVVAAQASGTYTGGSGSGVAVILPTKNFDTHNAYNTSTGEFTSPVSGVYRVTAALNTSANSVLISAYKNGSAYASMGVTDPSATGWVSGSALVNANAGDILTVRPNATLGAGQTLCDMSFELISGAQQILAGQNISSRMYYAGGVGGTSVTSGNPIPFDTKSFDKTGSLTTGASAKFTAPVAGIYQYNFQALTSTGTLVIQLYKNGSLYQPIGYVDSYGIATASDLIELVAGDYIDVRFSGTNTVYGSGHSTAVGTYFSIKQVN
jgi:hypothetical protein